MECQGSHVQVVRQAGGGMIPIVQQVAVPQQATCLHLPVNFSMALTAGGRQLAPTAPGLLAKSMPKVWFNLYKSTGGMHAMHLCAPLMGCCSSLGELSD